MQRFAKTTTGGFVDLDRCSAISVASGGASVFVTADGSNYTVASGFPNHETAAAYAALLVPLIAGGTGPVELPDVT